MNKNGDMFGMDRLNQVIARADEDPRKLLTTIKQSVAEHSADFPQSDDLTMVCLAVD
jgi:serine phosphatase RsbU (regulator of sigma subunit)